MDHGGGFCAREKPEVVGVGDEGDGETQRKGQLLLSSISFSVNHIFDDDDDDDDDGNDLIHCAYQLRLFAIMTNSVLTCDEESKERLPSCTRIIYISSQRKNVKYDRSGI